MLEMQQIVETKLAEMVDAEQIKQRVEAGIEKAINDAIDNCFKSYGPITKQLEKAVEEGLQLNLAELPFETYNQQMLVAIKSKMAKVFSEQHGAQLMSAMDELLAPAPKEIHINDLVEKVVEDWKSDDPCHCDDDLDEYATVEIEGGSYGSTNSHTLKMWKKKKERSYLRSETEERAPDLHVYFIDGVLRIRHQQQYNTTCFDGFEAFLFQLYAAKSKVKGLDDFDADDCDLSLHSSVY